MFFIINININILKSCCNFALKIRDMDYSYDYKHSKNLRKEDEASLRASGSRAGLNKAGLQSLAGAILLAFLLFLSSNQDDLFMKELVAVSIIWTLVSLVRLQGEPDKNTPDEKR
jgi:hypothetical protein